MRALEPLLEQFGNDRRLSVILFTLDETSYSRELAPLAGHYPALKLGPPWWFHDSVEGMQRFLSIGDRNGRLLQHRRLQRRHAGLHVDPGAPRCVRAASTCRFLASAVLEHRLDEDEAFELAPELAYGLAKRAYRL